ncbi:unnamed protein product [Ixodes persulcatus]
MCGRPRVPFDMHSFLDMIETFPFLYDKRHTNFKNKNLKRGVWTEIGDQFGLNGPFGSGPVAEAKFKNARDKYTRIKTEIRSAKRGDASGIIRVKWPYFGRLQKMIDPGFAGRIILKNPVAIATASIGDSSIDAAAPTSAPVVILRNAAIASVAPTVPSPAIPTVPAPTVPAPTLTFDHCLEPQPEQGTAVEFEDSTSRDPYDETMRFCVQSLKSLQEKHVDREAPTHDSVHLHCMLLASQIRTLTPEEQIDALHEIDQVVYGYQKRAIQNGASSDHTYS